MRDLTRREFGFFIGGLALSTLLITPHFSVAEMQCRCSDPECDRKDPDMNSDFMQMLEELRMTTFALKISSGARCLAHDKKISPKKNHRGGVHVQSVACDIVVGHLGQGDLIRLLNSCRAIGFSGQGFKFSGSRKSRFLHADARHLLPEDYGFGKEAVWSY